MTEQEYRELQAWCRSGLNKRSFPEEYRQKVSLRNKATQIKRNITRAKNHIKEAMFVLEACKEDWAIKRWTMVVESHKQDRDKWQKEFKNLQDLI